MRKFKYKTIKTQTEITDARLNVLGKQGWELCGVHIDNYGYTYYIKKEIIDNGKNNI